MSGFETAPHPGVYWAIALTIAVLIGVCVALARHIGRSRHTFRLESARLSREMGTLETRLETQQREMEARQRELEQTRRQLAEQAQHLARQTDALAEAKLDIDAKAAELARAGEAQSELLASVSHELRTPLNSALILSKLLADNRQENLTPEQVKFARSIYSAGNDLLELLNDILDLAHLEAGRIDIRRQPVELGALVESLAQTLGPIAGQKRLDLAIRLAPDLPQTLESDAQRVSQVLKHLLATAIKLNERGTVSLEVGCRGADIEFAVLAADATSHRSGGAGLGLSIARELALLLGGRIDVQSAPEQGAFRFIVPRASRMMAAAPAPARVGAGG